MEKIKVKGNLRPEERAPFESQLRQVLAIQYNGKNADIANALQNIKQEVENILSLSVEFEEFANKAAKYLDFLKEVKSPDFDFIKEHIFSEFGIDFGLAVGMKEFSLGQQNSIDLARKTV